MWPLYQKINFPKKLGISERLFASGLAKRGIQTVPTGSGLNWKLDFRNPTHRWIYYGLYDPSFLMWAKRFLPKSGVVVDSGANIGQTTMYLGQYVSGGRLFAFEPGRLQADWLEEGVHANREKLSSVRVVRAGLGAAEKKAFLNDVWRSERFHGGSSEISRETGEPVLLMRLDDFLETEKVTSVDLWKLDVEGYELEALEGASRLLSARRVRALYVELYRQDGASYFKHGVEIRRRLASYGYKPFVFSRYCSKPFLENAPTKTADGLFLLK